MSQPTCAILTVSDSCYLGKKQDASGPQLEEAFKKAFPNYRVLRDLAPDDRLQIVNKLNTWILQSCCIVLTTGGTGFSPRDVTPEATRAVIEREAPGIVHAMTSRSLDVTPMAMLSRAVCGIKDKTIVVNLPGSARAALECFSFIKSAIPHAVALVTQKEEAVVEEHRRMQACAPSRVAVDNVAERPRQSTYPMLEVSEALDAILKEGALPKITEKISVEEALHRVLAEDVLSEDDVPPFDASIKDGYAVVAADGAGPRRVRSNLAAGDAPSFSPIRSGEVVRISTGAPIPAGADAVVQVEDTTVLRKEGGDEVAININKAPVKGQDIRRLGCDVSKNTVVLTRGERLGAAHVGVLAAVGKSTVTVYRPLKVGVLTTGNELREHDEELGPGQIRDSNRPALINLLKEYRYDCDDRGIVRDAPDDIKRAVTEALGRRDVLITTGGVSMGEFDYIKRVLEEDFGATVHFGRVNVKPGKPTTFATLNLNGVRKVVFGLPGNPVSACVTCLLFVIPFLRYSEGARSWELPTVPYVVSTASENPDPRPEYLRVVVSFVEGKVRAEKNGAQISSRLNSLVGANGLLLMPGSMTPRTEYQSHIVLIGNLHL